MNRNDLRPLHAAIKASLRAARAVNSKRAASSVAWLALCASAWVPQASAADYLVSNETELRNAITAANAAADPTATITLTSSFTVSNTAFPKPTKSITIDTQGFVLSGVATGSGNINFTGSFSSGTVTFAGTYVGGNATTVSNAGYGLVLNSQVTSGTGQVIIDGSVTGGSAVSAGQAGGYGVSATNDLTVVNNGTISGGSAMGYAGNITNAASGVVLTNGADLINNGTVQGGNSQGLGAGLGVSMTTTSKASTVTNYDTIRGGSDLTGAVAGSAAIRGHGSSSVEASIVNFGLLEGGNGAAAITTDSGSKWNASIVNSGTIRAGAGQSTAIKLDGAGDKLTLELRAGSIIEGDVLANASGADDTLRLGGDTNASFDVSAIGATAQYRNFDSFEKTGASTWSLTGAGTAVTNWNIQQGTLQLGDGGTSGSIIGDVTNNGTFAFNRSDALAYDGVIGGNGVVRQLGAGTTTLSAAGSNASALDVQAGTLALTSTASLSATTMSIAAGATLSNDGMLTGTAGNDTFALAGTFIGSVSLLDGDDQVQIADGANFSQASFDGGSGVDTLDLTNSGALTLSQTLTTDFESLVKHGNGVLTLSGTVDGFSDSITIAAGTAHLDSASIQTDELRIDSGGTVTGTGTLIGNLNNAGTLSPGNSPGTIHVGGSYVQQASGTLISEITRSGDDLLDVAGSATLDGTHQIQVEYGLYLDGTTHTLIQAAGGITGDFASTQMNPSALMEATRELNANALTVSFERQPFTSLTDLSDGRERFAEYLEEQLAAGNVDATMTDYIDMLLQQTTDEQVANLLGERAEPVASVTQNNISILGATFAGAVFERFTLSDTAQCAATQPGSNDTLNCFWAHGLRRWGNASGDVRYDWTTDGGQIGVDRTLSSEVALGVTFGYADTGISDLNGGRNDMRSRLGGLYVNYTSARLTLGALAFYSGNDSETQRSVLVDSTRLQARADFDGDSYGASVRLGYRLTSETGPLVRPYIEAFYDHAQATEFAETGAAEGNLSAHVQGRDGLRGTLGLQFADDFEGYGRVFRPALDVGVTHHFEDVRSTLDLQPFSAAAAYRTYGPALDRTSYIARASLDVSLGKNASVALGYSGELSDDYSQHGGNLSFRMAW